MVSVELHHEIEQFLFKEASLLDDGKFEDWLDLFTDDLRYWVPITETRDTREEAAPDPSHLAVIEDDKAFLTLRIRRLDTGLAHAEQPYSRTRHFVTNVQVEEIGAETLSVRCNILVYQSRLENTEAWFVGDREDLLRRSGGSWQIASRRVVLNQRTLPRAVSILF